MYVIIEKYCMTWTFFAWCVYLCSSPTANISIFRLAARINVTKKIRAWHLVFYLPWWAQWCLNLLSIFIFLFVYQLFVNQLVREEVVVLARTSVCVLPSHTAISVRTVSSFLLKNIIGSLIKFWDLWNKFSLQVSWKNPDKPLKNPAKLSLDYSHSQSVSCLRNAIW